MKLVSGILSAAGVALVLTGIPAAAQQKQPAPAAAPAKQASPAALTAAKEILAMKNAVGMYNNRGSQHRAADQAGAVAGQPELPEGSRRSGRLVAQKLVGREKEIGDGMAAVYASEFSEQELKDLVAFYKAPLGQKLLLAEPKATLVEHGLYEPVGTEFCGNRQWRIPRRDAQAWQADLR